MTDNYELAETLGTAAAHELAAGQMGEYLKNDKLDSHDGEDVAVLLPDIQEVYGHFDAYNQMIDEIGEESSEVTQTDLSYVDDHLPEGHVSEEQALLMGYALEKMARTNAAESREAALDADEHKLAYGTTGARQDSISDIEAEENEEVREIEDLLVADDAYSIEDLEELKEIETLDDL